MWDVRRNGRGNANHGGVDALGQGRRPGRARRGVWNGGRPLGGALMTNAVMNSKADITIPSMKTTRRPGSCGATFVGNSALMKTSLIWQGAGHLSLVTSACTEQSLHLSFRKAKILRSFLEAVPRGQRQARSDKLRVACGHFGAVTAVVAVAARRWLSQRRGCRWCGCRWRVGGRGVWCVVRGTAHHTKLTMKIVHMI